MVISRRKWLKTATVAIPASLHGEPSDKSASIYLDMVLENRSFLALSPNDRLIATYAPGTKEKYRKPLGEESVKTVPPFSTSAIVLSRPGESDASLSVPAEGFPFPCEFFGSSGRLLAQVPHIENQRLRHRLLLLDSDPDSRLRVLVPKHRERGYYCAIEREMCVCKRYAESQSEGDIALTNCITGEELVKVPFLSREKIIRKLNPLFDLFVSADKSFFIYQVADILVCRETANLACRWTWRIPYPMNIRALNISPRSDRIVVALLENTITSLATKHRIAFLAAKDGQLSASLSLDGSDGVAVHPNNNVLAIGRRIVLPDQEESYRLSVDIVDVDKERVIRNLYHNETRGRRDTINSFFDRKGLSFSLDGRYLFVSAKHMKVWKLDDT